MPFYVSSSIIYIRTAASRARGDRWHSSGSMVSWTHRGLPLMRPIVDNLEILLDLEGKKKERRSEEELRGRIDYLFDTGVIAAEAMNFMRGRSITDTWLIIDEAQNLTPRQVKGIITRVGKGTKVVLLGDPAQIDHPLLDTRSNGLTYASARMKGSPLCVQLTMLPDECERSSLALDAAMRM